MRPSGPATLSTFVADLPELRQLSRQRAAKLVGVAFINNEYRQSTGKRKAPGGLLKSKGVLIDDQPERPCDIIDAQKRLAIPHLVASPQSQTLFPQSTPEYTANNSFSAPKNSAPKNTETHV